MNLSPAFSRKFELVSGWSVLKTVLPYAWDPNVNEAAFDVLLGRVGIDRKAASHGNPTIVCPHIVPAIFSALQKGLESVAKNSEVSDGSEGGLSCTSR